MSGGMASGTEELERTLEALLFLSAEPVGAEALADATGAELHEVVDRARAPARALRVRAPRASSCASWPAASRSARTPTPSRPPGACWPSRARRR